MMGSSPPPLSSNVQALNLLIEIGEVLKKTPADIKTQIASLQKLHENVTAEMKKLEETRQDNLATIATNKKIQEALTSREVEIDAKIALNNRRESNLHKLNEDLNARQQTLLDGEKELTARKQTAEQDIAKKLKDIEKTVSVKLAAADADIKAKQAAADLEIKHKQDAANTAIAAQRTELSQQAAAINANKAELISLSKQLRSALPSFNGA